MAWKTTGGVFAPVAGLVALALAPAAAAAPSVYVTDNNSSDVSQFSVAANGALSLDVPGSAATGAHPQEIALSPDGRSAYVTDDGGVSQYDVGLDGTLTAKSPASVSAGTSPEGIAVSPDGKSAYVANIGSGTVSQYDVAPDGKLSAKSTPTAAAGTNPFRIALSSDGKSAYVTNSGGGTVSQFDVNQGNGTLAAKTPATVTALSLPGALTLSPDGHSLYVADDNSSAVSQYNVSPTDGKLSAKTPDSVTTGQFPLGIAISPDGKSLYTANQGAFPNPGSVSQFNVSQTDGTLAPKSPATVAADDTPVGVGLSPSGASAYIANLNSSDVSQFDVNPADGKLSAKSPATIATAGVSPRAMLVAPDVFPPPVSIDSGPSGTVSSAGATFGFSASEAGATFACSLDGAAFGACAPPQVYSGLAEGAHTFAVRATDFSGNQGVAATRNWTVDTIGPTTTVNSGPPSLTNSAQASFSFSADDAGATFACSLDGAPFGACSSPQSYSGVSDGAHTFAVQGADAAGNTGPDGTRAWTVDTQSPQTTIGKAPKRRTRNRTATFKFAASEPATTFQCSLDKKPFKPCTSPHKIRVKRGKHTFQVRATDQAGNVDASAAKAKWTVKRKRRPR